MFDISNLLEQVNEHKLEFLHNRILRESDLSCNQVIGKIHIHPILNEEIQKLTDLKEALEETSGKLTAVGENALRANLMGIQVPVYEGVEPDAVKNIENIHEMITEKCKKLEDCNTSELEDCIINSCNVKDVFSPSITDIETKKVILGSVSSDVVKEAVESMNNPCAYINDIIEKAIQARAKCYGDITDVNDKIETINMNDNYTEEDVLNMEAAKMLALEECIRTVYEADMGYKLAKRNYVRTVETVVSAANYNPRCFRESNEQVIMNSITLKQILETTAFAEVSKKYQSVEQIQEAEQLDKLKSKMVLSNKRFLDKYEEAAKKSSCLGITIKTWYEFVDIDKRYKALLTEVKQKFGKKDYKSVDELQADYKKLKGSVFYLNGEVNKIACKQLDGKDVALLKNVALKKTQNHIVTKSDVSDAIKTLQTISREIDDCRSKSNDQTAAISYGNSKGKTLGKTKEERLEAKIDTLRRDLIKNLTINYINMKLLQLKMAQKQSRLVVMKAARQKPTNEEATICANLESCLDEIGEIIIK